MNRSAVQSLNIPARTLLPAMNSIDIFPWNENFDTGLAGIDEQHRELVRLLNEVAAHVACQADRAAMAQVRLSPGSRWRAMSPPLLA